MFIVHHAGFQCITDSVVFLLLCSHRCGPPSRYWCMRFEAKNGYFKDLAHRIKNLKNIPKSLAHRHQAWSCYIFSNTAAGGRIFKGFTTGPGMGYF